MLLQSEMTTWNDFQGDKVSCTNVIAGRGRNVKQNFRVNHKWANGCNTQWNKFEVDVKNRWIAPTHKCQKQQREKKRSSAQSKMTTGVQTLRRDNDAKNSKQKNKKGEQINSETQRQAQHKCKQSQCEANTKLRMKPKPTKPLLQLTVIFLVIVLLLAHFHLLVLLVSLVFPCIIGVALVLVILLLISLLVPLYFILVSCSGCSRSYHFFLVWWSITNIKTKSKQKTRKWQRIRNDGFRRKSELIKLHNKQDEAHWKIKWKSLTYTFILRLSFFFILFPFKKNNTWIQIKARWERERKTQKRRRRSEIQE